MVKRTVVWTETAKKQRRTILMYWVRKNGSVVYAEKLIKLISKQIKVIQNHPESFKLTDYPETRESALGHFSIYYKTTPDLIIITAFWDNRQDPKSLLTILMSK